MKIAGMRDPNLFQRLVQRLYIAERGTAFQVVDDSGGDGGNDGYDAQRGILLSIYCPEKPDSADYARKGKSDLEKAVRLRGRPGYHIVEWWFVTPSELREPIQASLRAAAEEAGLVAAFVSAGHLEDLYYRHQHLRDEFPVLEYPVVAAKLDEVINRLASPANEFPRERKGDAAAATSLDASSTILDGFPPRHLVALAKRLDDGDERAIAELERFQMESLDQRDRLTSILIQLEYAQDHGDRDRALQLAQRGLQLASSSKLAAEEAVFAANVAFEKAMILVGRDMEMVEQTGVAHRIGMLMITEAQYQAEESALSELAREVDELIRRAQATAERSNNLVALYIVLLRRGVILTQRHFPFAFSRNTGLSAKARYAISSMKQEMEAVYEVAIRIASALGSEQRLATAYGNFANDLVAFGDYQRGQHNAHHALKLAKRVGDQQQIRKTELLLEKIAREK